MLIAEIFSNPLGGLLFLLAIVIAISVHEFSHAKSADMLGDPTAASLGRVTLDPRAHLDLMGTIFLLLVGFGWGKPVPFDPYNLENPKRDTAIIAFAGPASNIIMAIIAAILLKVFILIEPSAITAIGLLFLPSFIWINVMLAIFNLLPFAPLDGYKIVGGFLGEEHEEQWQSLERFGMLFLLLFILPIVGGQSMLHIFLSPIIESVVSLLV